MKRIQSVLIFIALSYGLAWTVSTPLWLSGGLKNPLFVLVSIAMMFTPAMAAIIASKIFEPDTHFLNAVGVTFPRGSVGPALAYSVAGIVLVLIITIGALVVAQVLGLFRFDLKDLSAFRALLDAQLNG